MIQSSFIFSGWQESIAFFQDLDLRSKMIGEDALRKYGEEVVKTIHDILMSETEQHTNALVDSFVVGSPNLILEVQRFGEVFTLIVGTQVPYAVYLEYGFHFTGPKSVNIWHEQGFKKVDSFDFEGLHFVERAFKNNRYKLNFIIGKAMKKAGYRVNFTRVSGNGDYGE